MVTINVSMKYTDNTRVNSFLDNPVWTDAICNLFAIPIEKSVLSQEYVQIAELTSYTRAFNVKFILVFVLRCVRRQSS